MSVRSSSEVSGRTVQVAIEGVMSVFRRRIRNMLDDNGITEPDPQPEAWYAMDDFLRVLEDVEDNAGENALTKIGEATPANVDFGDPGGPAEALESLTDVYRDHHRNATGRYESERVDDSTVRVSVDTPYPCSFDRGLVKGTAQEFGAEYARVRKPDDRCRDEGDPHCVYEVSW